MARRPGERIERRRSRSAGLGAGGARRAVRRRTALVADAGRRCRGCDRRRSDPRPERATATGVRVQQSVRARLRHRRPGLHTLPRRHGAREPAERDRIDAQPADPVLRLRHQPNMDRLVPPLPGAPLPPPPRCTRNARGDRPCLLARCSGARRPTAERPIAEAALTRPVERRPSVRRRAGGSAVGDDDEAGVSVDLLSSESFERQLADGVRTLRYSALTTRCRAPIRRLGSKLQQQQYVIDRSRLTREERDIFARVSRRGFMGATAGATLAALVGREPHGSQASQARPTPTGHRRCRHRAVDGRRHGADRNVRSQALHAVRAGRARSKRSSARFRASTPPSTTSSSRRASSRSRSVIDRGTVIRTFNAADLGFILHSRHQYHWHTGYIPPQPMAMPHLGAVISKTLGPKNPDVPAFIAIGQTVEGAGEIGTLKAFHTAGFPRHRARAVPDRRSAGCGVGRPAAEGAGRGAVPQPAPAVREAARRRSPSTSTAATSSASRCVRSLDARRSAAAARRRRRRSTCRSSRRRASTRTTRAASARAACSRGG